MNSESFITLMKKHLYIAFIKTIYIFCKIFSKNVLIMCQL